MRRYLLTLETKLRIIDLLHLPYEEMPMSLISKRTGINVQTISGINAAHKIRPHAQGKRVKRLPR